MPTLARLALAATAALATAQISRAAIAYLTDLGFTPSSTLDIGADSRIVGVRSDADGFRVVLWQNNTTSILHTDPLDAAWRPRLSISHRVTLTGTLPSESLERALLLHANGVIPLGDPGSRALAPLGVHGAVGRITPVRGTTAAIFSPDQPPTPISLPDPNITEAQAIDANSFGDILISSRDAGNNPTTWLFDADGSATRIADGVEPAAMNDGGEIIARRIDTDTPVLITSTRSMFDLPTLAGSFGSTPNDISNTGIIVGDALVFDDFFLPTTRAWAWSEATGLLDLTALAPEGWTLLTADALNDQGQIVGRAEHHGVITGYRLTLVPTPATLALAPIAWFTSSRTRRRRDPSYRPAALP